MKIGLVTIIVLIAFSCRNQGPSSKPENLIPRQEFISLLIDLEIMEAYYEQIHKRPNLYKTTLDSASRQILFENNFTEEQLKSTLNYYSAQPDSLYLLYEETLDSLNSLVIKNKNQLN